MKRSGLIAMIALAALPLVTTGLAVLFAMPDTVPLHIGANGVDLIGSKYEAFEMGFLMTGCCALFAVMYAFMDKLAAMGLVHGTDAHGGRTLLLFTQISMNAIQVFLLFLMSFDMQ
ncbi:MAG: hypothetical protein PEGG_00626 [Paraeggerthella hongkongensis]|uniref:hypothetical protein n=1 Tax=Paraeggerthella sp. TaxID=2897350 RepID=UPI0030E49B4E